MFLERTLEVEVHVNGTERLREFDPHICKQKVNNRIDIFDSINKTR